MKFLITGASGQLGREWIDFLNRNEISHQGFSSGELDITVREDIERKFHEIQPDIVINCAAYTEVDGAETNSDKAFFVNEKGVQNLTETCKKANVKLVHYSTDYVFSGNSEDRKKFPDGYPEEAETDPVNSYGKSKEAGEKVLLKADCDWLLIRVSWLCGQYGSNFVKTMLRLGSERDELSIVDDQVGSPSLAFDVVEKTFRLIKKNRTGIYHISCEGRISWADLAEEIFKQTGKNVNIKRISSDQYPFTATRPRFTLLSNKKAKSEGLRILPWKKGLAQLLEQVQENSG